MAKLVFQAAIRAEGQIRNVALVATDRCGWLKLATVMKPDNPAEAAADIACHELNALLHAGFDVDVLLAASRLSNSNHAEIIRQLAEATGAKARSLVSFGFGPAAEAQHP